MKWLEFAAEKAEEMGGKHLIVRYEHFFGVYSSIPIDSRRQLTVTRRKKERGEAYVTNIVRILFSHHLQNGEHTHRGCRKAIFVNILKYQSSNESITESSGR